jgi:glycerol uptake facilitator-like aquaporin
MQSSLLSTRTIAFVALTAIVYAIGYRSGAQVNPAVTIGLLVARKLGVREEQYYIL